MSKNGSRTFLRTREHRGHARVTYVELFFDLVFVFAITQLSHLLLKDLTLLGALRTGLLFLAVWWVWIYTSWVTNWLDPERTPVRLLLFALIPGRLRPAGPRLRSGLCLHASRALPVHDLGARRGKPAQQAQLRAHYRLARRRRHRLDRWRPL